VTSLLQLVRGLDRSRGQVFHFSFKTVNEFIRGVRDPIEASMVGRPVPRAPRDLLAWHAA
jgi:hypothetical protein